MVAAHYIQCASARKTDSIPSRPQIDTLNLGNQSNSRRDSIKVSGLSRRFWDVNSFFGRERIRITYELSFYF